MIKHYTINNDQACWAVSCNAAGTAVLLQLQDDDFVRIMLHPVEVQQLIQALNQAVALIAPAPPKVSREPALPDLWEREDDGA